MNQIVSLLALTTAVFLPMQEKRVPLRLIHADELRYRKVREEVRQTLRGNVKFQRGATTVTCDRASQILGRDPVTLAGRVHILDSTRALRADTVYFYQKTSRQVASGHVVHITPTDTTSADRITYDQPEQKVVSEGRVRVRDRKENTVLTAGFALYLRDRGYGKIYDQPEMVRYDSLMTEIMRVRGDTMELFAGGDTMLVRGRVEIHQKDAVATCGRAFYYRRVQKTVMTEQPEIRLPNRVITGDTVVLFLDDAQLARAEVRGNARASSDADTLNPGTWVNTLTGAAMTFQFDEGKLVQAVVTNQATSVHYIIEDRKYKGSNQVSGDRIVVRFADGQLQRVTVQSEPDVSMGKYSPP